VAGFWLVRTGDAMGATPNSARPTESSAGLNSLTRGLDILQLVRALGRLSARDISLQLDLPLSTVYRYLGPLKDAGFLVSDGPDIVPGNGLADPEEQTEQLGRYVAPILRRMRDESSMTAIMAVRVHAAAVCIEVAFAHSKHQISFQRGQVRALYAGGSALPLLAFSPHSVMSQVLEHEFRRYTSSTPTRCDIAELVENVRTQGYSYSREHLTPGMVAVGIPVNFGGRCVSSLSLVGEIHALASVKDAVESLRSGRTELLATMPESAVHALATAGESGEIPELAARRTRTRQQRRELNAHG